METNKETGAFSEIFTLEYFKTWSSMVLKTFLSLRNRSVNGSIDVLAARFVYYSSFLCLKLFSLGFLRNFHHSVLSCKLVNLMKSDSQTVVQNRLTVWCCCNYYLSRECLRMLWEPIYEPSIPIFISVVNLFIVWWFIPYYDFSNFVKEKQQLPNKLVLYKQYLLWRMGRFLIFRQAS